jgi:hypothetical protein
MRDSGKGSRLYRRDEQLRLGRVGAPALRDMCPSAAMVTVTLRFPRATLPLHSEQAFVLYPAARAHFAYPCPYGNCDGVFDLGADASRALTREKATRIAGTLDCTGSRSRDGLQQEVCGLRMNYTIAASHGREPG